MYIHPSLFLTSPVANSEFAKDYSEKISDQLKVYVSTARRHSDEPVPHLGDGWTTIEEVQLPFDIPIYFGTHYHIFAETPTKDAK